MRGGFVLRRGSMLAVVGLLVVASGSIPSHAEGRTTTLTARPVVATVATGGSLWHLSYPSVSARLTGTETGDPIPERTVVFTADGTEICTATTGESGTAICFSEEAHLAALAARGYEAWFAGDDEFAGSSARGSLFVYEGEGLPD